MVSMVICFLLLPPKKPIHLLALVVVILIGLRLAGPQVTDRFMTIFNDPVERDESAQSRLDLWGTNWDVMVSNPVLGLGPDHWPLVSHLYGYAPNKEGHSLWLQVGAELGVPGILFLLAFYLLCMTRLWSLVRSKTAVSYTHLTLPTIYSV